MTRPQSKSRDPRQLRCVLIVSALTVGLTGYYGPWLAHRAAGLVVVGLDLAEYVKFVPQVISGQIAIQREVFYLPLMAGSMAASLLASRRWLPLWSRWVLAFLALPLALAMLPPAWSPAVLRLGEFRIQVLAIGVCLALVPGIVITRYLPDRLVLFTIAFLAVMSALGPTWAFLKVRPAIAQVYRRPPLTGWGFWLNLVGFFGAAFLAVAEALRTETRQQPSR
jgi:hypothetical protein